MSKKIFRNDSAKKKLEDWYQTFLSKIDFPTESIHVETSLGRNHILIAGDRTKPPLVCLHAMLTSSAHLVSELQLFLDDFHIIAPDLPGQSIRGLETRLSYEDDSFAEWLQELVQNMDLKQFDLLGISLGGFAALQFTKVQPQKVKSLILVVPAGIVRGSIWEGIKQMAIPSFLYQLNPSEKRLRKFLDPLLTTWDDDWAHYIGDAFTNFKPNLRIPPLISDGELQGWQIPTLVFAGEEDLSFPGKPMLQRLKSQNPDIQTELMRDCKHSPPTTPEFRKWLATRVEKFLKE